MATYFTLDPTKSRQYLEAVLVDAGIPVDKALVIAFRAHDCGGGDGDAAWQASALREAAEGFDFDARACADKAVAIRRVLEQFYSDVPEIGTPEWHRRAEAERGA